VNLGMSTAWRSLKIRNGPSLLDCFQGFDAIEGIELDYRILAEEAAGIAAAVRSGHARILSLHNYYPHPSVLPPEDASGDAFLLSSPDPEHRRLSLKYTRTTLRWAAELNAKAVVLHLGRVEMEEPLEKIKAFHLQDQAESPALVALLGQFRKEREARRQVYLETVMRNLHELLPLADRLGLHLGLENRYDLREIPDIEETAVLMDEFQGAPLGHWHDMGHAAVHENLGVQDASAWIHAYGRSLVGVHIHDTLRFDDHLAPGEGNTDFTSMIPCFQPGIPKILELRPSVSPEAVGRGISIVQELCTHAQSFPNVRPSGSWAQTEKEKKPCR
jgi:sugar phosphate isomerase/epimerase